MAKKKPAAKQQASPPTTEPKFPYTTVPNGLRTFLRLIPERPKPSKVNNALLKGWGLTDSNANSIIRVLKSLDLVSPSNEPTDRYVSFMQPATGPSALGQQIKAVYSPLFEASLTPYKDSDPDLRRLFNIHSGGGEDTLRLQIQTFKALCEYATFNGDASTPVTTAPTTTGTTPIAAVVPNQAGGLTVHVDLHIHLPENKSSRDYQAIIEDIAKYIYRLEDQTNA